MQDLTTGSPARHIVLLAVPIAVGMAFQMLYHLVDLYFVGHLGDAAIAGVSAAGNVQFLAMAATQVLGVGSMALISHALGRRNIERADAIYNQAMLLAVAGTLLTLVVGFLLARAYLRALASDAAVIAEGTTYLYWFLPALALQFPLVAMGSALRGCGIARPTMIAQSLSVGLNAVLAPVLIMGWGTGRPLGVAGAGLASSIAVAFGVLLLVRYFRRAGCGLAVTRRGLRPNGGLIRQILGIGLPPGGEFALLFLFLAVIFALTAPFGAAAQAGFGIGQRLTQVLFLPVLAISFAAAPVAGQSMGAGLHERIRETFRSAALLAMAFMVSLAIACQFVSPFLIGLFSTDPAVIAYGAQFLRIIAWNFIAAGLVFTASGMFQALGNTLPALASMASRLLTFVVPALFLSARPGFTLLQLWLLAVASVYVQAGVSLWLLRREFRRVAGRQVAGRAPSVPPIA